MVNRHLGFNGGFTGNEFSRDQENKRNVDEDDASASSKQHAAAKNCRRIKNRANRQQRQHAAVSAALAKDDPGQGTIVKPCNGNGPNGGQYDAHSKSIASSPHPKTHRMRGQQINQHGAGDGIPAEEGDFERHGNIARQKQPQRNVHNEAAEIVVDDLPDVLLCLRQRASEDQDNRHGQQKHGELQRGERNNGISEQVRHGVASARFFGGVVEPD